MADTKITALTALTAADPANDVLPIVDVSDTTMAASGTTKKISVNNILGASGTATLASATITGDLTVRTNKLKVTSIGVGTGTTTPAAILHSTQTTSYDALILDSDSASTYCTANWRVGGVQKAQVYLDVADDSLLIRTNTATGPLKFGCNNIIQHRIDPLGVFTWYDGAGGTRMTLNSTGLGVGVSPIASSRVSSKSSASQPYNLALQNRNATQNWYLYVDAAAVDDKLFTINDGTANRLTIDTSGNVGIGVTPSAWNSSYRGLQLGAGGAISAHTSASLPWLVATSNSFINSAGDWKFINNGYSTRYLARGDDGTQSWWTSNNGLAGGTVAYTQAMTLDASGNLLVGTTSLGARNTNIFSKAVGFALEVQQRASPSGGSCLGLTYSVGTPNNTSDYFLYCADATAARAYVVSNGNMLNVNGSYGTISDLRLKENISDARNYLADLLKLRVVKYSLKSEASPTANLIGLIAQEVEQVFPTLVETNADDVKSIKTTVLIPMLLKALQELTARVQTLETR